MSLVEEAWKLVARGVKEVPKGRGREGEPGQGYRTCAYLKGWMADAGLP